MSTSFKHGTQYKEGITNFRGTVESVTKNIVQWFGLTNTEGLTPFEIALRADEVAQACGALANGLDATPVHTPHQEPTSPTPRPTASPDSVSVGNAANATGDPWQAAEQSTQPSTPSMFAAAPEVPEGPAGQAPSPARTGNSPLYAEIARATSVDELTRLWAENQPAFADDDLLAAWKAKGRSLQQSNAGSAEGIAA